MRLRVTLLACWVWPTLASASPPVHIRGRATCPAPGALAHALAGLSPAEPAVDGGANAVDVQIEDLGVRYRVVVAGRTRELVDPARRCAERARAAAVVIALALDPPAVEEDEDEDQAPAPPELPAPEPASGVAQSTDREPAPGLEPPLPRAATVQAVAAAPPPTRRIAVDIGALVEIAPAAHGGSLVAQGVALHLVVGGPRLGLLMGATALTPATMDLGVTHVRMTRVPLDLGLRLSGRRQRAEGALDFGLRATVLGLFGQGTDDTRFDLGFRAAALGRLWLARRWAAFVSAQLAPSARSHELVVDGVGTVGSTPRLWLGFGLGLAARLD